MTTPAQFTNAKGVDDAREAIFRILQNKGEERVIYFHGWSGLGASTVLRSIAEVIPSKRTTPELCFDKIIHTDCSKWKGRRALQRAIAKELELDSSVMDILDKQDGDDDFNGVDEISRDEITIVSEEIYHILKDSTFILIFHSGIDDEIDLYPLGVPSFGKFTKNIMIWTYKRRILTITEYKQHELIQKLRYTHILAYDSEMYLASEQLHALLSAQLYNEAAIIVDGYPCMRGVNPMMVVDCCVYKLFMRCSFLNSTNSDWVGAASNHWICDGILQKDVPQEISDALHREIRWECDDNVLTKFKKHFKLPFIVVKEDGVYEEGPYRWISITSRDREILGMKTLPAQTSSFFLEFVVSDQPTMLPNGLFEHSSNLGVLTLCCCAFSFASPPFLKCHNLRFLGLDHCTDDKTGEGEDHTEWVCLHSLWVLDIRYTAWNEILSQEKLDLMELSIEGVWCWQYTTSLQGRLPNLQRLRVIKPTCGPDISTDPSNSFTDKEKLEILDLSGNSEMKILPNSLSKASSLQVLILDGCNELKNVVVPDGLPRLLKSFSFDGYGPAFHRAPVVELPPKQERPLTSATKEGASVSKISLDGCSQLENLFVRGLPNLVELDLSRTAIRTLDFNTMVLEVPMLKRLFLLGCEHLRAIIWGSNNDSFRLNLLCIDTRAGTGRSRPCIDQNKPFPLEVHAIIVDARLARSLRKLLYHNYGTNDVYFNINVTSAVYSGPIQSKVTEKEKKIVMYGDQVSLPQLVQADPDRYSDVQSMVGDAPMLAFPEPPTNLDQHIEITEGRHALDRGLGDVMTRYTESLHVHDVSTSASLPRESWRVLRQCRMERCPKLGGVFPSESGFKELETFWASDLLMARWICSKGYRIFSKGSFRKLQHLHLRSCPRLQFVLPVWVNSFPSLETLHIIHCGYLRHVFVLDGHYPGEISTQGVAFPRLTTIHLHDLPVLQQICEVKMVAPKLKTIKIRGCWGLRRLQVVGACSGDMKKPTIEIEKDVWDALEWDGGAAPDHFEAPVHSRYYKKKLPRVSVLR